MNDKTPPQNHPEPVNFLTTPPLSERDAVNSERRRYSRELAEAAVSLMELHKVVYVDSLTGLGNRRMFDEQFPNLFGFAKEKNLPIALAYADVRGLKRTNDNDGHEKGDELLKAAGEAFIDILREGDIAIHLSGDEFVAVLVGYAPVEGQTQEELDKITNDRLAARFDEAAQAHGIPEERHVGIDVAITSAQENDTPGAMLTRAETQMRAIKEAGYSELRDKGVTFEDKRVA